MKAAYLYPRILVLLIILALSYSVRSQQYSAGINTETPNPNAVLHLVAPNGDQGLIVPTLTTAQRTAMALTATENGLLVFDSTDGLFYYYLNGWIALTTAGSETDPTVPATIKDGIDWTELTGIPGVFADGTDDVIDPDADVTNELITGGSLAGNILTITEAGVNHNIDLSAFASAPQDLQFAGNILSITGDPTPTSIDFTLWDQNAADDITTANVGTAANQIVQLDGVGALPAVDGSNLTGILNTVTSDGTTIIGDGVGTPLAANVGTGANQIVQLDGLGALPAVDGSSLTGVTSTVTTDGTTITGDGSVTALSVGSVQLSNIGAGAAIAGQVVEFDGANWVPAADDGLTAVTTDITLVGDGTAATPLSLNRVDPAIIAAGGAIPGQILEYDGANWVPITNSSLTSVATDGTTIAGDGVGTPLSVGSVPLTSVAAGGATLGQTLEYNGTNWIPGADDVGMLAATYDPNTVAGDAFKFGTHSSTTAAVAGNVLTFDGTTWDAAAPVGLTLPYSQSVANAADLFYIDQAGTGPGGAARFSNSTGTFSSNVVNIEGNGQPGSNSLSVIQIGSGGAGSFSISGTGSGTALSGATTGTGSGGVFQVNNALSSANALSASTNGTGTAFNVTHSGTGVGTGFAVSMTQATGTGPGISVNHAGLGAGIEINTITGPPMVIPGGALGEVLTSDALGNITLQPGGLNLPYTASQLDAGPLLNITNTGAGPAATFINSGNSTALGLGGNLAFSEGASRVIGVLPNTIGPGDGLNIISGDAGGTGGPGGDLVLSSGSASVTGNGGNIVLSTGVDAVGTNYGGVFINAVTRFGNQNPSLGGAIELEDASGANTVTILADGATVSHTLTLPADNAIGALTNDGLGALTWAPASGFQADIFEDPNNVIFGALAATQVIPSGTDFQLGTVAPGAGRQAMLTATSHGAQSLLTLIRANGSQAGPLAIQATDVLGGIEFIGYDGGGYTRQGMITGVATENWTGVSKGTDLLFYATPSGTSGQQEMMRISGNGVQINGTPRINNPTALQGGAIELEDDGGANALRIQAAPTSSAYAITFPVNQGTGALTNDGSGALTWQQSGAFTEVATRNLLAIASPAVTGTANFVAGNAGGSLSSGNHNILIGEGAGGALGTGSSNIALGFDVGGPNLQTSSGSILLGSGGRNSDDSPNNVGIGQNVIVAGSATSVGGLSTATGGNSIALGTSASATGNNSVALGFGANAPQDNSAIIGDHALPGFYVGLGTQTPSSKLDAQNTGTAGGAGSFVINNASNTNSALRAETTGPGNTISVNHSNALGVGINVDMNGTGDNGLRIGGTTPGEYSVSVDGGIELQTKFTTRSSPSVFDVDPGNALPIAHRVLRISGSMPFNQIEITGALDGQELIIVCTGGSTPQADSGPNLRLSGGTSHPMTGGSTLHLIYIETQNSWLEIGRSL